MAQPTTDDIAAKFCRIVGQTITTISEMTDDLRLAGLTENTSEQMQFISKMAAAYDNHKLVGMFIMHSANWKGIIDRDLISLVKSLPKIFEGLPIDISLMTEPISLYLKYKSGALPPSKGKFPITDARIEGLWKYFDQLMKGAYIYAKMTKIEGTLAQDKTSLGM